MLFFSEISLVCRAMTAIAAIFWNGPVVRRFFSSVLRTGPINIRKTIKIFDKKVETYIQNLIIPESLKKELPKFSNLVGHEIIEWINFHMVNCELAVQVPQNFVWTAQGTIDQRQTADVLVHDETIAVENRFKLACLYCLEEHIFTLWPRLDENSKQALYFPPNFKQKQLVMYWFDCLKFRLSPTYLVGDISLSPYVVFRQSLIEGNGVAARFFGSIITEPNMDVYLVDSIKVELSKYSSLSLKSIASHGHQIQALLFLLNHLEEERQIEILEFSPLAALNVFLERPWQNHFMNVYHRIEQHLSEENFFCLLDRIVSKLEPRFRDYDYRQIFIDVWMQAPAGHRIYIVDNADKFSSLLLRLVKMEDRMLCGLLMEQVYLNANQPIMSL